jgi:hypothetical protein
LGSSPAGPPAYASQGAGEAAGRDCAPKSRACQRPGKRPDYVDQQLTGQKRSRGEGILKFWPPGAFRLTICHRVRIIVGMKNEAAETKRAEMEAAWQAPAPDRDEAIARIRTALKSRSGRAWSVKGGRGTAWGWIKISAPPARLVCGRPGIGKACGPDCTHGRYYMADDDMTVLALLLGKDAIHFQGESIPASSDYRREYVDRAEGRAPSVIGRPYWD